MSQLIRRAIATAVTYQATGAGGVVQTVQTALDKRVVHVSDFGVIGVSAALDTLAINTAISVCVMRGGGVVIHDEPVYQIASTIVVNSQYVMLAGRGGAIDGNQPFDDTWPNIEAHVPTRWVWAGAAGGTMLNMQPIDDGAHVALNGNGVVGILFDGAETAGRGWLFKTLRGGRFADCSVIRCTVANIDLGVTTNSVYGGNTSLSNNVFDNVCASNANITATCNGAFAWNLWGNALAGNVCQNEFRDCQGFHASYATGNPSWNVENSDDNSWYEGKWNGSMILHAEDTGTYSIGESLAQNHFFYKTLGHIHVREAANPATKRPSYGHVVYGYSGNLIAPPTVDGRGDISVVGSTIDYAQRSGVLTYGCQPAITNCYLSASQSMANGVTTKITWAGSQYDRLSGWNSGAPTDIVVPQNVKWASVTLNLDWDNNSTGQRYAGVFLAGGQVGADQRQAMSTSEQSVTTGVIPVTPGQVIDARVMQASGGALNIANTARLTVQWY
ncbi:Uncharacterised protein [Burkholderia pseudomallei]|uniref:hypothetical protein n=1 Tax=Burkholderia pseudomallei TaxID=28450 RepID=UPI000F071F51|nr:hypothetical protein [Burkholderia pseudomallei]VCM95427.1 Uncharacterised protein [Burkholderia pseudomallei]VCN12126.1 Uncharacterised protein [Burkholderia pseudomallei]VCN17732.1 Uncharacterised protein [Burkholderia pseudomallei]VCN21205.1 Uncharacterised protein [Burkholderia pseudomallei]VCN38637.1 Uncharacterised protein [Burkholderia pseudomallei]